MVRQTHHDSNCRAKHVEVQSILLSYQKKNKLQYDKGFFSTDSTQGFEI